ncbi:SUMO-specific isopeptidase USPL1 [Echeneis naucrates]|uniref:SUMO-specific isopeptidase USPL1 n=1 Tax=Echeneis naucrates TaxID=173247 RepID=UPI0011134CF9|nr:SUMO-specific isopeptidase USPL1 [Echeneis naucrates]
MVILSEWHRTVEQKSSSGLPMTGEDTGLEALASPLAGYLGKVQERAASLEHCPWCTSKGLKYALRSYRINFQESVSLCTNPQCLFPLVSRSLEDILASLSPVEPAVGSKRKNPLLLEADNLVERSSKRLRSNEIDRQSVTDTLISQTVHCAVNAVSNGQHEPHRTDGEKVNGHHRDVDCRVEQITGQESLHDDNAVLEKESDNDPPTCSASAGHWQSSSESLSAISDEVAFSPHYGGPDISEDDTRRGESHPEMLRPCSLASNQSGFTDKDVYSTKIITPSCQLKEQTAKTQQKSQTPVISTCKGRGSIKSETEDRSSTSSLTESHELVSVPNKLFWRNSDNLCWLDSLLCALVNCKSLRKCKPRAEPQQSSVWKLIGGYEDICASIQIHQQTGRDGVVMVPMHVLQKANADLQALRMSAFKLLQPKLQCKLGQRETPVFAMPLLLEMDSWVGPLFRSTFHWQFTCSDCKIASKERISKTLPTFTNIMPDWHPLHAVHSAPCNECQKKNQRRTMLLESVPPVFVLHFVEGLPDNNVRLFTFNFKGKRYSITTVIQYNHQLRHFVSWISNSDGSWMEYDDLKHPDCKTHQKLPFPAREMHIVFWEAEDEDPRVCSPTSTFSDCTPSKNPNQGDKNFATDKISTCSPDQSVVSHSDIDILSALSVSEEDSNLLDTTLEAGHNMSIGSTTLLDTFEGLSHNEIVTLTLVEIKPDAEMQPVTDNNQPQDGLVVPTETPNSTPDSSSTVTGSETVHGPEVGLPTAPSLSDPESGDGSSSDPTYVPGAKRGRGRPAGRGKAVKRQKGKKATSSKAAPCVTLPLRSEPSEVISSKPEVAAAQGNHQPVETTQPTPPLPSSDKSPLPTSQTSPPVVQTLDQKARWSFLLSRHPQIQAQKTATEPTPTHTPTSVKQIKPTHFTPNPGRRQLVPGGQFPKPQIRSEGSQGLPMKAAEMYDSFNTRSSNPPSPLPPSPGFLNGMSYLPHPISTHLQKSQTNTTVVPGVLFQTPKTKLPPEISKKQRSHSKVPPGLCDTEVLRYKLLKKLKAKKKKLAKLNLLLGQEGGASLRPDSTNLTSPSTVTSSTYDGSACDDLLSDLLTPATTASNFSPDSTIFLEMLGGQDGAEQQLECGVDAVAAAASQTNEAHTENFLEEFLLQAEAQQQTELERETLSALEMFF